MCRSYKNGKGVVEVFLVFAPVNLKIHNNYSVSTLLNWFQSKWDQMIGWEWDAGFYLLTHSSVGFLFFVIVSFRCLSSVCIISFFLIFNSSTILRYEPFRDTFAQSSTTTNNKMKNKKTHHTQMYHHQEGKKNLKLSIVYFILIATSREAKCLIIMILQRCSWVSLKHSWTQVMLK